MEYCVYSDLPIVLENIDSDYFGTGTAGTTLAGSFIVKAYNQINAKLTAELKLTVPLGTIAETGKYDQALVDWNANLAVHLGLLSYHAGDFADGEIPGWIKYFGDVSTSIFNEISSGNIVLDESVSRMESGIGKPSAIGTVTSEALFYTNWRGEIAEYSGSDFERKYIIQIDGTLAGTNIGQAKYKFSRDGYSFDSNNANLTTGTGWTHIENNIYVRWESNAGTAPELVQGDAWEFTCVPKRYPVKSADNLVKTQRIILG